jgi:hypothetical protein
VALLRTAHPVDRRDPRVVDRTRAVFVPPSPGVDTPGVPSGYAWWPHGNGAEGSASGGNGQAWFLGATAPLTSGHGSVPVMLPTERVAQVDLLTIRAGRLCIESIEVRALSAVGSGCAWVGPGGELHRPRPGALSGLHGPDPPTRAAAHPARREPCRSATTSIRVGMRVRSSSR